MLISLFAVSGFVFGFGGFLDNSFFAERRPKEILLSTQIKPHKKSATRLLEAISSGLPTNYQEIGRAHV
jgi:hypothetical protein